MNTSHINRLVNLVRKTGHPVVLSDTESDDAVVVMNLSEYEQLIGEGVQQNVHEAYDENIQPLPQNKPVNNNRPQPRLEETTEAVSEEQPSAPQPIEVGREETQQPRRNDLTADASKANINREIGGQKAGQGKRQNQGDNRPVARPQNQPVNQPSVQQPKPEVPQVEPETGLDDEERFYLEPLE